MKQVMYEEHQKKINKYNLYVKENFQIMKQANPHLTTSQLMKQLSREYKKKNQREQMIDLPDLNQRPNREGFFTRRLAPPRQKFSPLRPAPLSQGIFTNSTDTKDRNGKDFLLPTPLRPAPLKMVPAPIPRPVSISDLNQLKI